MTDSIDFLLNVNAGEIDVLHRFPSFEECNVDDSKRTQHVDPKTAAALVASGQARACEHCFPPIEGADS